MHGARLTERYPAPTGVWTFALASFSSLEAVHEAAISGIRAMQFVPGSCLFFRK
jgi:hypothetical protein